MLKQRIGSTSRFDRTSIGAPFLKGASACAEKSGHLLRHLSPEQRVPAGHPLRAIRTMTDDALRRLSRRFEAIYATTGRPSIPPEHLLRALLLQVLIRCAANGATTSSKKARAMAPSKSRSRFLVEVVGAQPRGRRPLSAEHFTVDGTLVEAWDGQKSFKLEDQRHPPDDPAIRSSICTANGVRTRHINRRLIPTADCSRRQGHEAKLAYLREVLMENRHGLGS